MNSKGLPLDLRSDTLSKPTPAMLAAMLAAEVGDEQKREDPTVIALEQRVAGLLDKQEAVFVPSATMANQIALRTLARAGDEVIADAAAHIFLWELGGPAALAGLAMKSLPSRGGGFDGQALRQAFVGENDFRAPSRVLCIENTHAESGGRPWPADALRAIVSDAQELGLLLHLDGARLLNAAIALELDPAAIAAPFETVTFCLTKGLGCPVGALLAGSAETIARARREKQLLGGAMRQAGFLAAAGLYALDHNVERLAEDHLNARLLAERLAEAGIEAEWGQTNIVLIDAGRLGGATSAQRRLRDVGVLFSTIARPNVLRAVTYVGIDRADIAEVARRAVNALADEAPMRDDLQESRGAVK